MKKLICMLLALSLMTLGFAMAETIAPMVPETLNTTDAEYPAAFNRDDLKDGYAAMSAPEEVLGYLS